MAENSMAYACAYLWQLLTDYTSRKYSCYTTWHCSMVFACVLSKNIISTWNTEPDSLQELIMFSTYVNVFFFIHLNYILWPKDLDSCFCSLSDVNFKLHLQICNNWQFPWVLLNCVMSRMIELYVLEMNIADVLLSIHEHRV